MLPGVSRLKTTIGRRLSMQREMAVASITFNLCSSTWRYEIRSKRVAAGMEHRIRVVDPVHLGRLQDHFGLDLHRPERRGRIGAEIRIAGAGAEHDDASFFQVADRPPADERLGHRAHLDRRDDAGDHVQLFERVLKRQRVDDRRQHPHVVRGGAIHAARARRDAAEDVAAADDDGRLHAHRLDLADLLGDLGGHRRVDPVVLRAQEGFAGEFQEDAFVDGGGSGGHRREIIDYGVEGRMAGSGSGAQSQQP